MSRRTDASGRAGPSGDTWTATSALLRRAAELGAATGLRSSVALVALTVRRQEGLPAALRQPAARPAAVIAAGGELIGDKLPGTPSRLEARGLLSRVAAAAAAAAIVARTDRRGATLPALEASAAALAAARIGHDTRALLSRRLGDLPVAVAEDVLAIGLAAVGSGRPRSS